MSTERDHGWWRVDGDAAWRYGPDGRAIVARISAEPGGYRGWWLVEHPPRGSVRYVGTRTVPSIDDAIAATEEVLGGVRPPQRRPALQAAQTPDTGGEAMNTERDTLREQLAALAHEQWSGWMAWMLPRMTEDTAVERWRRQMQTPYADLSEQEKQSDRAEADKVLALLREAMSTARDTLATDASDAAMEVTMAIACAHGLDGDQGVQRAIAEALTQSARGERDALIAALVAEYCAILEHAGPWAEFGYQPTKPAFRLGGREALERVARSLGVLTLHDQAADRVAQRSTQD